ncbi:GNAT family N-acetyltransferase [Micromonospora sp. NBC_00898]|uniref:GNAT family N-acetyltransferase n=1 Tax=Micromonospora sp. NBC_00898 TaxID=2975981 RepID=UPI003867F2BB|nr:GNAT family N-acetyltransferase [Micromonospora sp. NBC_00898]
MTEQVTVAPAGVADAGEILTVQRAAYLVEADIGRLSVAPDQQGRGVGARLLAAIEAACAGRVDRFALFTGADSADNLRLYDRRGYRVVAHRPDPNGFRLAVLEKTLVGSARRDA